MRKIILAIILFTAALSLHAQKDSTSIAFPSPQKDFPRVSNNVNIIIYPVPVREDSFTIKSDKDISFVKITNIIGQDIFRVKFNNPQQLIKILLDNTKRGMYLVTIIFADGSRVVKKIMVEETE